MTACLKNFYILNINYIIIIILSCKFLFISVMAWHHNWLRYKIGAMCIFKGFMLPSKLSSDSEIESRVVKTLFLNLFLFSFHEVLLVPFIDESGYWYVAPINHRECQSPAVSYVYSANICCEVEDVY